MRRTTCIILLVTLSIGTLTRNGSGSTRGGDLVGLFDSLDAMAARSDAVLLIRVEEHVQPRSMKRLGVNTSGDWSVEDCYVTKSLKGSLPESQGIRLRLFRSGVTAGPEGFDVFSRHVVFLKRRPDDGSGILYESLKYQNSHIQVSPDYDPRLLAGKSLKERLAALVREYRRYRDAKARREDAFFTQLLK